VSLITPKWIGVFTPAARRKKEIKKFWTGRGRTRTPEELKTSYLQRFEGDGEEGQMSIYQRVPLLIKMWTGPLGHV